MPSHLVSNMDDSWDQHKNEIRMLYYSNDRNTSTLKSIMAHMKERRSFDKSKSQYERQFKKWGFQKNNTGSEWKTIHGKIEKRQRQGKESVVYQSGRLIRTEKVNKAKRHNFRKAEELFKPEEVPKTPEGFSVCTPMADNMPHIFINNLPSLQLFRRLQPTAFTSPDDMNTEDHELLNLVSSKRGSSSLHEIFRTPHAVSLSSVALPLLHACSNNLLSDEQATDLMDMILESGNRSVFKALISQQTPATKAIARKLLPSAVASGNISMVQLLLDTGISPDLSVDSMQRRPLLLAIEAGNYELVKMLLDHGARANSSSPYETASSLAVAAGAGRSDLVRLLLDSGANVHSTRAEQAILPKAASSGSIDVVELLLDAGADIDAQYQYPWAFDFTRDTALHVAVERENLELIRFLLDRGARTDILGSRSRVTALVTAVSTRDVALVQLLLSHGANANGAPQGSESPLCRAVSIGRQDLVQLLLSRGADANGSPQEHGSPLCRAASLGRQDLVNLLLAWGASDSLSAMDAASKIGHMEIVRICFDAGTLLNDFSIDAYERMAIRSGVRCGDYHFVQQFLNSRRHIDVDAPAIPGDAYWETSLLIAAKIGRLDLAKLLIHFGANVNSHFACRTTAVLCAAIGSENVHLVEYLLRCGACINAPTDNSWGNQSPLCRAARLANTEIVKLLLEWGADTVADGEDALLSAIDSFLQLAFNAGRVIEVVRLLLEHRVNFTDPRADGNESCQTKVPFRYDHIEDILCHPELVRLLLKHRSLDPSEALIVAIGEHDLELVKLFLENGADVNTESQDGHFAFAMAEDLEILHSLLVHGANAREKARALQIASLNEDLKAAHLLLQFGADVNADPLYLGNKKYEERGYRTALQAAAGTGNLELVQLLLEKGAEIERLSTCSNEKGTALQFAAISGSIPIVNELIQKGANVNARPVGEDGRTALEGAAEHGRLDMVQLLLNLEAETQGSRALQFARNEGHEGVVALLLENGFEEDFNMSD